MKRVLPLTLLAAGVTLAIIIGQRMSTDAMAVALGVVFGVAASIPTSLLVVAATRRASADTAARHSSTSAELGVGRYPPPPQVYIVNPGQQAPWLQPGMQAQLPLPPGTLYANEPARRFKVVGEDEYWLDPDDQ